MDEKEVHKTQTLLSSMSQEQLDCYEVYRQSAFPKATMKFLMQNTASSVMSQNPVIAMSKVAKIFINQVVEEALDM